ncbi:hypothetical protein Tco_1333728 [Tanacetum coccineum]
MPKSSLLLKMFDNIKNGIKKLAILIHRNLAISTDNHFFYDDKSEIRHIFHSEVQPISQSLRLWTKVIKEEITKEVQEMLDVFESMESKVDENSKKHEIFQNEIDRLLEASLVREVRDCVMISVEQNKNEKLRDEIEKISNDSKDVQANLLKRIVILENDFQRCQAQSIDFELQLQHQKEKNACDNSWTSKMEKLNDENVSLAFQVESLIKERESVKLEYQKLFNSIKTTRAQHQREVNELIENVNQKTYAYGDVRSKNQDLLMTISELKAKLKSVEKGKNVDTKFDKSLVLGKLVCVTPMNKNKDQKSKFVPKIDVKQDLSKPVTSHSSPKLEQVRSNTNAITRGIVEKSSSVSRPESKSTNLKKNVLLNTKSKSTSKGFKKNQSSVSSVSNKSNTSSLNVSKPKANVLNAKFVNAMNDGSNVVCVSCGKDVFMLSHDKCVARYALSMNSRVKRALFTSPLATKTRVLGATPVVAKTRFNVATPATAPNKVSSASSLTPESRQVRTLSTYMITKIETNRK